MERRVEKAVRSDRVEAEVRLIDWQKSMLSALLERLPPKTKAIINESVRSIGYGAEQVGEGQYDKEGRNITVSQGIVHPRYFIELALFEMGRGVEEWLREHGHDVPLADPRQHFAVAFALAILEPGRLEGAEWKKVAETYREAVFEGGFPKVDAQVLVEAEMLLAYERISRSQQEGTGTVLKVLFEEQSRGYLAGKAAL